jgi:preprotein translocase subunit SecY
MAPGLKERIWFTVVAMAVWRLGAHIPLPGVDLLAFHDAVGEGNTAFLFYQDLLTGGGFSRLTILALGLLPYFSALVLVLLLAHFWTPFKRLWQAGKPGRQRLGRYVRWGTLLLAATQSYGLAVSLESFGGSVVSEPGLIFRLTTVCTLTAGTVWLMWLAERITRSGIGNGPLLILAGGVLAHLPYPVVSLLERWRTGALSGELLWLFPVAALGVILGCTLLYHTRRRVIVQYPRRQDGAKMFGGKSTHVALGLGATAPLGPAGAAAVMSLLAVYTNLPAERGGDSFGFGAEVLFWVAYLAAVVCLAFIWIVAAADPVAVAKKLEREKGFIPGVRPGKNTAEYLDHIVSRWAFAAAVCIALLCGVSDLLLTTLLLPLYFSGSLLVVTVFVVLELMRRLRELMKQERGGWPPDGDPPDDFAPALGMRLALFEWDGRDPMSSHQADGADKRRKRRAKARVP